MNYHEIKPRVFAQATRDEGYFGDKVRVGLAFDEKSHKLIEVHEFGCHVSLFLPMDFQDETEAHWHVHNHPMGYKNYRSVNYGDYSYLYS